MHQNYTLRGGELDLIARDGEVIVFVEVKQRSGGRFGGAAEAITPRKLGHLRRAALTYLLQTFGRDDLDVRFDALLVHGTRASHRLEHLKAIG